jgi:hypothetical protein
MMRGYVEGGAAYPAPPRRYRVVPSASGWAVAVNDATTRPLPDRATAERLAARLQAEADRLNRDQHRWVQ